jgi:hypothetical protein
MLAITYYNKENIELIICASVADEGIESSRFSIDTSLRIPISLLLEGEVTGILMCKG